MKTSELTGSALDWAVAKAKGNKYGSVTFDPYTKRVYQTLGLMQVGYDFRPSTNWKTGGPIIEREGISVKNLYLLEAWVAKPKPTIKVVKPVGTLGQTPLIAAMRCYVASKLGDEVEVPDELL